MLKAKSFPFISGLSVFACLAAGFSGLAIWLVLHGGLNADEGFYLAAARLVSEGLLPYRDFGYTQGPVLPYVDAPWLELFGYSLAGQRLASLAWTLIMVMIATAGLRRRGSWMEASIFMILLLGAPGWLAFAVKGKTYAFGGLMVLAGAMSAITEHATWRRWTVFILAAALGCGTRYPMAGFFAPAWIWMLIATPGAWRKLTWITVTVLASLVLLLPFAASCWSEFLFWTVDFHRASSFKFSLGRHFLDCFWFAPALWILVAAAWVKQPSGFQRPLKAVIGSLTFGVIVNLSSHSTYAEYVLPFFPALAFIVAPLAAPILQEVPRSALMVLIVAMTGLGWLAPPEIEKDVLLEAGQAETFLKAHVAPGSLVVASMPEIPAATGYRIPPLLAMGKFSITEDFSPGQAASLHMATPQSLQELIRDRQTRALVLSTSLKWNFMWSLPSYQLLSGQARAEVKETVTRNYDLSFANGHYVIFLRKAESERGE